MEIDMGKTGEASPGDARLTGEVEASIAGPGIGLRAQGGLV
jgi:hypothetical protein